MSYSSRTDETSMASVDAPSPGYVIVNDSFYPGWQVSVDGRPQEILPANAAFRAVAVPAGRHLLRFQYRPVSIRIGVWLTCASVILVGLGLLIPLGSRALTRRPAVKSRTSRAV